ncbi:MAG: hypothetical protein ATN33_08720 [Epulopiscium sp. Nele67-Bin001]|nr:MAG: hypothetical protein ATN33_08720 [Epulopiscium sp. Nele67-Bin001]
MNIQKFITGLLCATFPITVYSIPTKVTDEKAIFSEQIIFSEDTAIPVGTTPRDIVLTQSEQTAPLEHSVEEFIDEPFILDSEFTDSLSSRQLSQSIIMFKDDVQAVVYGKMKNILVAPTMIDDTVYISARVFVDEILNTRMSTDSAPVPKDVILHEIIGFIDNEIVEGETSLASLAKPEIITITPNEDEELADFLVEFDIEVEDMTYQFITIKTQSSELPLNEVVLNIGTNEAIVDGVPRVLSAPVVAQDGIVYFPFKTIATLYGLEFYESQQQLTVVNPVKGNHSPEVEFAFLQDSYIKGENVRAQVYCKDEDDDEISTQMWQVNDINYTVDNVHDAICLLGEGENTVAVKVKDEHGFWSDWYTSTVNIIHNYPPVILKFKPCKEVYEVGERICFNLVYTNERNERIKSYKYTYKQIGEANAHTIVDKPCYIYDEGEYIVKLTIEDELGNWSETIETKIVVEGGEPMSELETVFNRGSEGVTITNFAGYNFRRLSDRVVDFTENAGLLVMSNSPEIVRYNGILYEETLIGQGRVLLHHIHGMEDESAKKLMVVLENPSDKYISGVISNCVIKGPSPDVLFLGQTLLYEYFEAENKEIYSLAPGETKIFYTSEDKNWGRNMVISGMFDFHFVDEVIMTVASVDMDQTEHDIDTLNYLNVDEHPRGTFEVDDIDIKIDMTDVNKPVKFLVGEDMNEWVVGWDPIMDEIAENRGNFGIIYSIEITAANEDVAVFINPRGNMFRGALQWSNGEAILAPKTGIFPDAKRGVYLGTVKANHTRTLKYMLPNGSSAPVLFGLVPQSSWEKM